MAQKHSLSRKTKKQEIRHFVEDELSNNFRTISLSPSKEELGTTTIGSQKNLSVVLETMLIQQELGQFNEN